MTTKTHKEHLDLAAIRARLAEGNGQTFWRSLEELAGTKDFQEFLHREFPQGASEWEDGVSRRNFLKLMGASLALAGLNACTRQPAEKIVPYNVPPPIEEVVPGRPLFFATAMPLGGFATGLLVESHLGRPTKVEGNPNHSASLGGTDIFAQAAILTLYDPDRSTGTATAVEANWKAFLTAVNPQIAAQRATQGAGLRILTETVTSPTLAKQIEQLLTTFPQAKWVQYEPVNRDAVRAGAEMVFGQAVATHYQLAEADVILSLDADFLVSGPGNVRYARDFANRRRVREEAKEMNRLYVVENTPSLTGGAADHRLPLRASQIESFARALAKALGIPDETNPPLTPEVTKWLNAVANDLKNHEGKSLIIAGEYQSPAVHALAHLLNQKLGNIGKTVVYTAPIEAKATNQSKDLRDLSNEMASGKVEALFILGGNPAFDAPTDLKFTQALPSVPFSVHLSLYRNETSELCKWTLPEAHFLEAWGDARAYDGTASIIQPLIAPLHAGKTAHEVLALLLGRSDQTSYDVVREYWQNNLTGNFEAAWQKALQDGFFEGTKAEEKGFAAQIKSVPASPSINAGAGNLEVAFRPDPTIWDGRFANNGWLQELPKPLTKLTWDNAVLVSPATAERFKLQRGTVVDLSYLGKTVSGPVWIMPGHAEDCVTLCLGYGRTKAGSVGSNLGFNPYTLRTADAPWIGLGLDLVKTNQDFQLVTTQEHRNMEGRNHVRVGSLAEFIKDPESTKHSEHSGGAEGEGHGNLSLYERFPYEEQKYAWGMAIDLNSCIGCNACTIACQAENNISIVGKAQVANGREMHWIRIDTYYEGGLDNPNTYQQPVACMHCELAPCETVCPVEATVHDDAGLNQMIYNRCVGTRYCSNNCPYKVRRFNFLQFADETTPSLKLARNPNVTVRTRGIMEKCTYCVQRINAARIEAKKQGRDLQDGEIVTACEAVCPTQAIVFGNINDPKSRVAKLKAEPHNYGLLEEINVVPRTSYLARLKNLNPALAPEEKAPEHGEHG